MGNSITCGRMGSSDSFHKPCLPCVKTCLLFSVSFSPRLRPRCSCKRTSIRNAHRLRHTTAIGVAAATAISAAAIDATQHTVCLSIHATPTSFWTVVPVDTARPFARSVTHLCRKFTRTASQQM